MTDAKVRRGAGQASRWVLLAGLFVGLSFGSPALGAAPSGADPALKEQKRHYNAGVEAADAGDWAKADAEFAAAEEAKPDYRINWARGGAKFELGKYRDATAQLETCLREGKRMTAAQRKEVEEMLAEARAKLVTLRIRMSVPGAEILVDGEAAGTSPLDADVIVDPGRRRIVASKPGVTFVPVTLALSPGEIMDVTIDVEPPPRPPVQKDVGKAEEGSGWKPWAVAGGTTVAVTGIGTGIGILALTPEESRQENTKWAVASFAIGGAATVGTILVAAFWAAEKKPAAQKSAVWVAPMVSGRENGIWLGGAF